ncbi:CBS domain-containing protein [Xanthobacter autotrophicus]|uniref:CBS domain-containing protein n=1 Tax=Xanthobacter autotrophicus TaxID=280 RepID=UPI0037288A20
MSENVELKQVVAILNEGKTVPPVTVRSFLSWFNIQRRTRLNVEYIDSELAKVGIQTVPSYLDTWVDNPITFELVKSPTSGVEEVSSPAEPSSAHGEEQLENSSADDPSFKIGKIITPDSVPVSVKPNASLQEATTIMLVRNFSQVPVMTNERDVKGVVSWTSIGARAAANITGNDVQSFMDEHREISASATLFDAIKVIRDSDYVLVRAPDRRIIGIVTATDIAQQFEAISTPFLLLAEIENHLRSWVAKKLTKTDIKNACSSEHLPEDFSTTSDLTFGNLVRILEYAENWGKLNLVIDRSIFCSELSAINRIRNDVMHFDPDPLTDQDIAKLRNVSRLFDGLRSMGAF